MEEFNSRSCKRRLAIWSSQSWQWRLDPSCFSWMHVVCLHLSSLVSFCLRCFFLIFSILLPLDVWWQAATDEHLAHISMMRCSQHGQFGCCIDLALPDPLTLVTSCHPLWPLVTFRSGTSTTFFIRLLDRETKEKATCLIWSAFTSW